MAKMPRLTPQEIALSFQDETTRALFPPILTLGQFAALFQIVPRTAKHWIASGDFAGATTRAGKHRRIWRDRAIQIAFGRERTAPRRRKQPNRTESSVLTSPTDVEPNSHTQIHDDPL